VLAVSPDGGTLVISDPIRKLVYLYSSKGSIQTTYGGVGTHAQFTPDSSTVYITMGDVDSSGNVTPNNQLLVHSAFVGWYLTTAAQPTTDLAIAVPSVGAFFAGSTTTARGYCPVTTTITGSGQATTSNVLYPDASVTGPATDRVATTNDGLHVLGAKATAGAATFTDLALGSTGAPGVPLGSCPDTGLVFATTPRLSNAPLPGVTATSITGVVPTSDSSVAFVTYTGSGGVLPIYKPSATGTGTLGSIPLATSASGTPVAPVSGVISSDNGTFYIGTSGDNVIHQINRGTLADDPTKVLVPKLPDASGNPATPDLLVQRPRKSIS
jgi:trimeric autotransporter adhesin